MLNIKYVCKIKEEEKVEALGSNNRIIAMFPKGNLLTQKIL